MEIRKLQKTGGTTYTVSLPKKWIEREKLGAGSIVSIDERKDRALILKPGAQTENERKEVQVNTDGNLRRALIEKYLLGYDVIKFQSKNKLSQKQKKELKQAMRKLIGLEILEETSSSITIHSLLNPAEVSVMKSLKRMYTIIAVMHRDLITALDKNDQSLFKDIIQRDLEVDRLYFLLVRQIRTLIQNPSLQDTEGIKAVDCVDYRLVAKILEQIGDRLERVAKELLKTKPNTKRDIIKSNKLVSSRFVKELKNLATSSYKIHELASKALFSHNVSLTPEVYKLRKAFPKIDSSTLKTSPEVINNLVKVADYGKDLADIVVGE